jgi:hypothetical protein
MPMIKRTTKPRKNLLGADGRALVRPRRGLAQLLTARATCKPCYIDSNTTLRWSTLSPSEAPSMFMAPQRALEAAINSTVLGQDAYLFLSSDEVAVALDPSGLILPPPANGSWRLDKIFKVGTRFVGPINLPHHSLTSIARDGYLVFRATSLGLRRRENTITYAKRLPAGPGCHQMRSEATATRNGRNR